MQINDQIYLELLHERHAHPFYTLLQANRAHLREWLTWPDFIQSPQHFSNFIAGAKDRYAQGAEVSYAIMVDGDIAGRVGLYYIDKYNKIASIGYWMGAAHQGRGVITECCKKLVKDAFLNMGMNRIEIKCAVGNEKSRAVAERLSFTQEGIIRQGELLHEQFVDLYLYAMLKENWPF